MQLIFSLILPFLQSEEKFSAHLTTELQDEVYCAFIDKFKHDQSELEKLFEHFRQFCVFARPPVQNLLLKHFIRGSAVTDRRGLCYNCKERIPSFTFRHELRPILRTHARSTSHTAPLIYCISLNDVPPPIE